MDRLRELREISAMRKLDRNELREYETLARIKQEAENNPAVVAAKAEAARQAIEAEERAAAANTERAFQTIFSTVVPGKTPMLAVDKEANRREIISWVPPGEVIPNIKEWFLQYLKDTPSIKDRVAWTPYLTPAQKLLQAKEDQNRLWDRFEREAKVHGLTLNEANFNIWQSVPDGVISVSNGTPCIINQDGSTVDLVPADQATIDQWAEDARQKAFQINQDKLRVMRDTNDIMWLRKKAAAEYAEKHSPQTIATAQQERVYKELRSQYEKDSQAGFWEPLPAIYTKQEIYKWDANLMRKYMSRYGASRITARIHDLTTIPDGSGGVINFEEKR